MDFVFSDEGMPDLGRQEAAEGNIALGKSIFRHKKVVAGATFVRRDKKESPTRRSSFRSSITIGIPRMSICPNFPTFEAWARLATSMSWVRTHDTLFAKTEYITYYPLSLQLALLYWASTRMRSPSRRPKC